MEQKTPTNLLSPEQAADYLGMSRLTMNRWRCQQLGPAFIKIGSLVKYRLDDLNTYIEKRRIDHTVGCQ